MGLNKAYTSLFLKMDGDNMEYIESNKQTSNILRVMAVYQTLYNNGYIKESDFILDYLIKNGCDDTDFYELDGNIFDTNNWIDGLSIALTDKYDIGYPCFIVMDAFIGILKEFPTFNLSTLLNLSFKGINDLFWWLDDAFLMDYIDIDDALKDLKAYLKSYILKQPVNKVNKIIKDYMVYCKMLYTNDILFKYDDAIYISYDIDDTFIKSNMDDYEEFISDLIDEMAYIEDMIIIYDLILKF